MLMEMKLFMPPPPQYTEYSLPPILPVFAKNYTKLIQHWLECVKMNNFLWD